MRTSTLKLGSKATMIGVEKKAAFWRARVTDFRTYLAADPP
jgi:hypothetical protein